MNGHFDLVEDMPLEARRNLAGDLLALLDGAVPTRADVIALRIAGDDEMFAPSTPLGIAFKVVRQLVERGHLSEDNIERYDLERP